MPEQTLHTEATATPAAKGTGSVVQAASLFAAVSGLLATHQTTLDTYKKESVPFNHNHTQHIELINQCSQAVKDKLAALQSIDKKMATGLGTGFASSIIAIFFPFVFGPVATASFAYAAYQWGVRQQAYLEYNTALENLVKCCVWSLGKVNSNDAQAIQKHPTITTMMQTLAPLTNTTQLKKFIDDGIENQVIESIQAAAANVSIDNTKLEEEQLNLYFRVYGYQQGGFLAILSGLWYTIKNMFSKAKGQEPVHAEDHGKGKVPPTDGPIPDNATATAAEQPVAAAELSMS